VHGRGFSPVALAVDALAEDFNPDDPEDEEILWMFDVLLYVALEGDAAPGIRPDTYSNSFASDKRREDWFVVARYTADERAADAARAGGVSLERPSEDLLSHATAASSLVLRRAETMMRGDG
jgi:hypothetical protein